MTEENNDVWLVWKISKTPVETDEFHKRGIYPSGELMGVCPTEKDAKRLISYLEEFSPTSRFGRYEDERKNSMDDAPYAFTYNKREMNEF